MGEGEMSETDVFARVLWSVENPDDVRFWHDLGERERMDYRTRSVEMVSEFSRPTPSKDKADG